MLEGMVLEKTDSSTYLDVVLHEGIKCFPTKTLRQFLRSDRPVAELKFVKNSLQRQGDASLGVIALCRHFVYRFPQLN